MFLNWLPRVALASALLASYGCDVSVDGKGGFSMDLAAGRARDTWTRSYPVSGSGRLELINVNGKISAEPTDGAAIELVAARTAKAGSDESAKALLQTIEMREEVSATSVRVEVRPPKTFGLSGSEVEWTVKVPRGVSVDLQGVNGKITVDRLQGDIRLKTVNGGLVGRALAPSALSASVVNGGIDLELASVPASGDVEVETVNGGTQISLPADAKATIEAEAVNGGVAVSGLSLQTTGEQTRRHLEGTLNGGGVRIHAQTVNGGVRIKAAGGTT
jgi:DUF4097 and DUF4098 domain-containing protein YvlB